MIRVGDYSDVASTGLVVIKLFWPSGIMFGQRQEGVRDELRTGWDVVWVGLGHLPQGTNWRARRLESSMRKSFLLRLCCISTRRKCKRGEAATISIL